MTVLNAADADFTARLEAACPGSLKPLSAAYLEEPRGRFFGHAGALVAPRSAEEVAAIVRLCADARVGIVPWGGGTGLVGGQIIAEGAPAPVILSLERMAAVRAVYPEENVMIAEAGAVLADVHDAAEAAGRLFPLTLASQGSCRIGGNLATNAGGVNVLRYGNARELCLGIEAVLADGTIWHGLKRLRKDNTGYDLRDLIVGSEGTLGIITAAALKLFPRPAIEGAALMAVESPAAALKLLALARDRLGEGVSAFELMHRMGFDFLTEAIPEMRQPFETPPEWTVLIDLGLPRGQDVTAALEAIFEAGAEAGLVSDGVIAQSEAQRADFWALRERIPEANRKIGAISSHDISLPLSEVPAFIDRMGARLAAADDWRVNCFGHLGDGNLHYNVFPAKGRSRADYEARRGEVKRMIHDMVHEMGGSVSAEHGIGRLKVEDLERYGDPAKLAAMRAVKAALDPLGILNPGAVLRGA
ncbi:MAG: FAD-binding oxidoreductase [Paracoccaceae bacterium]|nr:FAD-binding oxidoreductase [Paracoccaceae bacterium]